MSESDSLSSVPNESKKGSPPVSPEIREAVHAVLPEVLSELFAKTPGEPKDVKAVVFRQEHRTTHTKVSVEHSGPLPPPSQLAAYNEIIPQGADRIMKMAEAQATHRIDIEKQVISCQQTQEKRGQNFAFIIALAGLAGGVYTAVQGHPVAGSVIGGSPLVGLVSVFLYSKHKAAGEREGKSGQMENVSAPPATPPEVVQDSAETGNASLGEV